MHASAALESPPLVVTRQHDTTRVRRYWQSVRIDSSLPLHSLLCVSDSVCRKKHKALHSGAEPMEQGHDRAAHHCLQENVLQHMAVTSCAIILLMREHTASHQQLRLMTALSISLKPTMAECQHTYMSATWSLLLTTLANRWALFLPWSQHE
jgi:hypothetical protein